MSNSKVDNIISSSKDIKIILLFLLVAEVFILVTALGISDLQLLISNDIYSVPFLGFSVNTFYFFIFAPLFIFIFNYNALSSLLHHGNLIRKAKYKSKQSYRKNRINEDFDITFLNSNFINKLYDDGKSSEKSLIHVNLAFLLSIIPIFIQIFLLIRFLDYQSLSMSIYHYLMLIFTCYLSVIFWQRISIKSQIGNKYRSLRKLLTYLLVKVYFKMVNRASLIWILSRPIINIIIFIILTSYFIGDDHTISRVLKDNYHWALISTSIVSISLVTRTLSLSIIFTSVFSLFLVEFYDYGENNISIEIICFIFVFSALLFKLDDVRTYLIGLVYRKDSKLTGDKKTNFHFLEGWHFIEFVIPIIAIWTSTLQIIILVLLLTVGKFDVEKDNTTLYGLINSKLDFINSLYPYIDVSERQIFNLSKSSQLFELSNYESDMHHKNIIDFKDCASYTNDICHYIEPITISNRNLIFAKFFKSSMYQIRLKNSNLNHSDFRYAHLHGAKIVNSTLKGVNFGLSELKGSTFEKSNLDRSNLSQADFSNSSISDSLFTNLTICHTSFINTSFYGSEIYCDSNKVNENNQCNCNLKDYDVSSLFISKSYVSNINIDFYGDDKTPIIYLHMLRNNNKRQSKLTFRNYPDIKEEDKTSSTQKVESKKQATKEPSNEKGKNAQEGILIYELMSGDAKTNIQFTNNKNNTNSNSDQKNRFIFYMSSSYIILKPNGKDMSFLELNDDKIEIIKLFIDRIDVTRLDRYDPNSYSILITILTHLTDGNLKKLSSIYELNKLNEPNIVDSLYCQYLNNFSLNKNDSIHDIIHDQYVRLYRNNRLLSKSQIRGMVKDIEETDCDKDRTNNSYNLIIKIITSDGV